MKRHILCSLPLMALLLLAACAPGGISPLTTDESQAVQDTVVAVAIQQTLTAAASGGLSVEETPAGNLPPPAASVPMVSVSTATNCRTGPGEPYEIVGALAVGEHAEVIGRNQSGDTWIIRLPSNPSVTCWLWGYYATVEGDTAGLTIYTPPPTPTPAAGFTIAYSYLVDCGEHFGLRFQLTNTGTYTWKSHQVDVTDNDTSESRSESYNGFQDASPGCVPTAFLEDLTPGEMGGAGNWFDGLFDYDPTGHSITAAFRLCTEDGMGGTCEERSISFTP